MVSTREGGDIGLFVTLVPEVLYNIIWLCFSYSLSYIVNNFGDFYSILIGWLIKLSVQTLHLLIVIYKRDNFVYHHWGMFINLSAIVLSLQIPGFELYLIVVVCGDYNTPAVTQMLPNLTCQGARRWEACTELKRVICNYFCSLAEVARFKFIHLD